MAFLTAEQKKTFSPIINVFGYMLASAVMVALACKFILSGYPPVISWMEPLNELIIIIGAIFTGISIYANNRLVK